MSFCLTDYDAIGFDLDHTLAKYKLTEICKVRMKKKQTLFKMIRSSIYCYTSRPQTGVQW